MKNYKELIKELEKDEDFTIEKSPRKTTIKVINKKTGRLYSVHPGENAVKPLESWIKKQKQGGENVK